MGVNMYFIDSLLLTCVGDEDGDGVLHVGVCHQPAVREDGHILVHKLPHNLRG